MKPATPLPWKLDGNSHQMVPEDAAYAEHACNAYPKLVEALYEIMSYAALMVPVKGSNDAAKRDSIVELARAAIAKAKGEQ